MRRPHHKSRNGCTTCKRRRVKCDEKKPSCKNCTQNGAECSLKLLTPSWSLVRQERTTRHDEVPLLERILKPHSLDLENLELLRHYTSIAYLTIGTEENMIISQERIPQMAFSHDFLMHGMLAVSALHLARLQPQRKEHLVLQATKSQDRALRHYRSIHQDDSNVHASLAYGGFLVPYILAQSCTSEPSVGRIPSLTDDNPHWFHIIRGLVLWTLSSWQQLLDGPYSPVLQSNSKTFPPESNPDDSKFTRLHRMLDQTVCLTPADVEAVACCRENLEKLRLLAAVPVSESKKLGILAVVNMWPGTISATFVALLDQRRPEALVILAHYCVILKKVDSIWFMEGVGEKMLSSVAEALGPEWMPWIQWAVEQPVS